MGRLGRGSGTRTIAKMRGMKRARTRSPDPRQALHPEFVDSLDESLRPLSCRKHACTLFNQGIRRKPISALNGTGCNSAHSNTNKDLRNICFSNNIFQSQTFLQGSTDDFSPLEDPPTNGPFHLDVSYPEMHCVTLLPLLNGIPQPYIWDGNRVGKL